MTKEQDFPHDIQPDIIVSDDDPMDFLNSLPNRQEDYRIYNEKLVVRECWLKYKGCKLPERPEPKKGQVFEPTVCDSCREVILGKSADEPTRFKSDQTSTISVVYEA